MNKTLRSRLPLYTPTVFIKPHHSLLRSFVPSDCQLADLFTKPLLGASHCHILNKLGVMSLSSKLREDVGEKLSSSIDTQKISLSPSSLFSFMFAGYSLVRASSSAREPMRKTNKDQKKREEGKEKGLAMFWTAASSKKIVNPVRCGRFNCH